MAINGISFNQWFIKWNLFSLCKDDDNGVISRVLLINKCV